MNRRHVDQLIRMVAGAAMVGLSSLPAAATTYNVIALPTGGNSGAAAAVNASGTVVGWANTAGGQQHAFLWQDEVATDLNSLSAASGWKLQQATGINAAGDVVGIGINPGGATRAFLLQRGAITDLGTLSGYNSSGANGINDEGQVCGASQGNGNPPGSDEEAFFWSKQTGLVDLHSLYMGPGSHAYGINNAGQVVGAGHFDPGILDYFATLWDRRNGFTPVSLGRLDSGIDSSAIAINQQGQIVGWSANFPLYDAFFYSGGVMTNIGNLGGFGVAAQGINDPDDVVGYSFTSSGQRHAFLYTGGVMTDLNTLIPAGSGWVLENAFGVNNRGEIVGYGNLNGNEPRPFLLTPAHP